MKKKNLTPFLSAAFCTFSLLGIFTTLRPAFAVDSVYLGLGATSCKNFTKIASLEGPEGKEKYKPFLIWVSGAGTGYENACRSIYGNQCSGKNLDLGRLMVGVREQCNKHPSDLFGDAVTEAWRVIYFTQKSLEKEQAEKEKEKREHYKKKYQQPKISKPPLTPKQKKPSPKKSPPKKVKSPAVIKKTPLAGK